MLMKIEPNGSMTPIYSAEENRKAERATRIGRGSCGHCKNQTEDKKCDLDYDVMSTKWCDGYKRKAGD